MELSLIQNHLKLCERLRPVPPASSMFRDDIISEATYHMLGKKPNTMKEAKDLIYSSYCHFRRKYIRYMTRSQMLKSNHGRTTEIEETYDANVMERELSNSLSELQREVFSLRTKGFTHKEIGEKLGITNLKSRKTYSTARQLVSKIVSSHGYCPVK